MSLISDIFDMSNLAERKRLGKALQPLNGKVRIEATAYRPRRSDRQNRMYWPCVVHYFAEFLREQGEPYTEEEAHGILKAKFLRLTVFNKTTGEVIGERIKSTTELNTKEFAEYVDSCVAWLADMFHIVCPDPVRREEISAEGLCV